jgi:hypothetical protein
MKDRRIKQDSSEDGYQWEGVEHKKRVNEYECGGCIFVFIYENRRLKPVEIVLRRRGEEKRENNGGGRSKMH